MISPNRKAIRLYALVATALFVFLSTTQATLRAECKPFNGEAGAFRVWPEPLQTTDRTFLNALNNPTKLSDFSGKATIVHFWGTWCPPCLKEMPSLDRFQEAMADEPIEIVPINRDSGGTNSTIDFYVKNQLRHLAIYTDRLGLFAHDMQVGKVPVTILLNEQGLEIGRIFGLLDWDSEEVHNNIRACLL